MSAGSFQGVKRPGRGADPQPHLQCRGLKLGRAIPLPALRALVACYRENLYLYLCIWTPRRLPHVWQKYVGVPMCTFVGYITVRKDIDIMEAVVHYRVHKTPNPNLIYTIFFVFWPTVLLYFTLICNKFNTMEPGDITYCFFSAKFLITFNESINTDK